jgi:hypothetical protein
MRFLGNMAGYALESRIRNTTIRREFNAFNFNNGIMNIRNNWSRAVRREWKIIVT